ncbi:uncharacterized protein VP01_1987g4 [Puccinia sorghi]|uniref:HAT C-terminal dimerisation domain-containing protein n=1 Tax=Puccinia sorghi TaxID=27349 RepID=A0A0L6VDH1_9BASI|nr:uncharacterized protein VP01_1987g4 [Puccinia sorghi]
MCIPAIPASSLASEKVASQGRHIISWKRSSLKPQTIEELLCMKEWAQFRISSPDGH